MWGLVEGHFNVWAGSRREPRAYPSWFRIRARMEDHGRTIAWADDHDYDPGAEANLEVLDLERALDALNRKAEGTRSERWRVEAAMVLWLRMRDFSWEEISSVMPGRNVQSLASRAAEWITRYLNGEGA
ncbi:MAG: hypothetical protein ACREKK_08080 [Candidatus Methylomirabilales bacterium]